MKTEVSVKQSHCIKYDAFNSIIFGVIKWWFFSADDEVVGSEITNWSLQLQVCPHCLCKHSYVYEAKSKNGQYVSPTQS